MDSSKVKEKFAGFIGTPKYDKFLKELRTTSLEKGELNNWQLNLWEKFLTAHNLLYLGSSFSEVANIFNVDLPKQLDNDQLITKWEENHRVWICRNCS